MTRPPAPPVKLLLRRPDLLLAFGLGTGLAPRAPGTAGSALGLASLALMTDLTPVGQLAVATVGLLAGIVICGRAADALGVHDHPGIVLDEIVGIWVTFIAVPLEPAWLVAGFVLFRIFDILKPWPIRRIDQRLGGGLGIMADDLAAGLLALGVLHAVLWWGQG